MHRAHTSEVDRSNYQDPDAMDEHDEHSEQLEDDEFDEEARVLGAALDSFR